MTFSILGRCERTGRLGMAVTSSSPAVAARCATVAAGIGVAASQNVTDPRLGPALLEAPAAGNSAQAAIDKVAAAAPHATYRQLAVVDADGLSAAFSGAQTLGIHGTRTGDGWACAGNLLTSESVLDASPRRLPSPAPPSSRTVCSPHSRPAWQGAARPARSVPLASSSPTPLRGRSPTCGSTGPMRTVPDGAGPIEQLAALWKRWAPQRDDYVTRALHPESAPAYHVPGDPGQPEP